MFTSLIQNTVVTATTTEEIVTKDEENRNVWAKASAELYRKIH